MSAFSYTHTQALSSTNWTVQHNLFSKYVNLEVIVLANGKYQTVWPQFVGLPDENTATITFSSPQTGFVRVGA